MLLFAVISFVAIGAHEAANLRLKETNELVRQTLQSSAAAKAADETAVGSIFDPFKSAISDIGRMTGLKTSCVEKDIQCDEHYECCSPLSCRITNHDLASPRTCVETPSSVGVWDGLTKVCEKGEDGWTRCHYVNTDDLK